MDEWIVVVTDENVSFMASSLAEAPGATVIAVGRRSALSTGDQKGVLYLVDTDDLDADEGDTMNFRFGQARHVVEAMNAFETAGRRI
jgi:hypothetical protein